LPSAAEPRGGARTAGARAAVWLLSIQLLQPAAGAAAQADPRLENAQSIFAILDMDGDRKVTFREFAFRKMDAFSKIDSDQDGYLAADEVLLTPEQFVEVDRDQDGKVGLLEFIDSRYGQFEIYDIDNSGAADVQEFTRKLAGG
jgi:Ca2+-binding EF-hand superfamily protein